MTKVCIATGSYFHPQETQVAFHIQNLFDGNVCVLHEHHMEPDPFGVEHHSWVYPKTLKKSASRQLVSLASKFCGIVKHNAASVPFWSTREGIKAFLHKTKPDAILAEFGNVALRIAPVANEVGIPIFSYFRGADASSQLQLPLRAAGYRKMMPRLHGVFAVSQFLLDELAAKGVIHANSHVVPSGVNTDLFVPAEKQEGSFIALGRLVEKKRPDLTVRAFCKVAAEKPGLRLDVVGDGPMIEQCEAIVAKYQASEIVTFHGALPHTALKPILSKAEVFLQHSVRARNGNTEGLPTAIQEAMSCGLGVVSTRHAGIPEAVEEGVNGFLVDEGDEDGFVDAIRKISSNADALRRMAVENRLKAVNSYDNRKLIRRVEREILSAIGHAGQPRDGET